MQQSTPKVLRSWFLDLLIRCKLCHRAAELSPSPGEQISCFMTGNFIKSAAASQMRYYRISDSCLRCFSLSCLFAPKSPPQRWYFSALKLLQNKPLPTSPPFPLLVSRFLVWGHAIALSYNSWKVFLDRFEAVALISDQWLVRRGPTLVMTGCCSCFLAFCHKQGDGQVCARISCLKAHPYHF